MVSSTICHRAAADEYRLPRLTTTKEDEGGTTDKPALLDSASSTSPPPPSYPHSGGSPNNEEPPSDRTKKFQVVVPRNAKPGLPFALIAGGLRLLVTCPAGSAAGHRR
jgi:hypothetical protein